MFPYIRQHDNMQCGAACIGMICRYYGSKISLSAISSICSATNEGISLLEWLIAQKLLALTHYLVK